MDKYKDALQDIQKWTERYADLIACDTEIRAFITKLERWVSGAAQGNNACIKRFSSNQDEVMDVIMQISQKIDGDADEDEYEGSMAAVQIEKLRDFFSDFKDDLISFAGCYFDTLEDEAYF